MSSELQLAVQKNCHISDARHAGDYTMCVYLLKMREYYRWEQGFAFNDSLPSEDLGDWLNDREELWEALESESFAKLPVNGHHADPFETDLINGTLVQDGLVYSAGYGLKSKPLFFLAELEYQESFGGYNIYVSSREFARDLTAPPAMSLNGNIFIRRESLRRYLWERIEEWRWNRLDNPMGRTIRCYDFEKNPDQALEDITDKEVKTVLLHEIGEILAGEKLGPDWEAMLTNLPRSHAEIMLRAVRDHLADALSTLPRIIEQADPAVLHFYFANLTSMRKTLYPTLLEAYQSWCETGSTRRLQTLAGRGADHWLQLSLQALGLYQDQGLKASADIESLIKRSHL